jgi:hypothetical protein
LITSSARANQGKKPRIIIVTKPTTIIAHVDSSGTAADVVEEHRG